MKNRKKLIILVIISIFLILGIVIYNIMLSDVEENFYFIQHVSDGSILYRYDSERKEVDEIGFIEYGVEEGIVDEEKHIVVFYHFNEQKREVGVFDIETGETEIIFREGEQLTEDGMIFHYVDFDQADSNILYLSCYKETGEEKDYYLLKYSIDSGDMSIVMELGNRKCWRVYGENIYLMEDDSLFSYNVQTEEESLLLENYGRWDISPNGTRVIIGKRHENSREYYIYDLTTGESIAIDHFNWFERRFRTYRAIYFSENSNTCIINSGWQSLFRLQNHTLIVKEPGKIGRIIFFSRFDYIDVLYKE